MILEISGSIPEDVDIYVRIANKEELLNFDNPLITFDLEKSGDYKIYFYQNIASSKNSILKFVFYIFTCIFQGFFHILFLNSDSNWWNRINPYCLNAEISTKIINDTKIKVEYTRSYYKDYNDTWTVPNFNITFDDKMNIEYMPNPNDFRKQYLNFVKKFVSIAIDVLILFFVLLYSGITKNNLSLVYIMIFLIFMIVSIVFLVIFIEYRRMKKLYNGFLNWIK